jgi:hypothetical protein
MGELMTRLSIREDPRAPYGLPIALVDTRTNNILSCSRSVADAEKQRAVLLMGGPLRRQDDPQRFADRAGQCFPIADGESAFRSWADVHTRGVQLRYSPTEYAGLLNTVESALLHYFGVVPELRDFEDPEDEDDEDHEDPEDSEDDPEDNGGDDERLRDVTPYSAAYFTMLSKPTMGEFEQRRPWPPAIPADRRSWR